MQTTKLTCSVIFSSSYFAFELSCKKDEIGHIFIHISVWVAQSNSTLIIMDIPCLQEWVMPSDSPDLTHIWGPTHHCRTANSGLICAPNGSCAPCDPEARHRQIEKQHANDHILWLQATKAGATEASRKVRGSLVACVGVPELQSFTLLCCNRETGENPKHCSSWRKEKIMWQKRVLRQSHGMYDESVWHSRGCFLDLQRPLPTLTILWFCHFAKCHRTVCVHIASTLHLSILGTHSQLIVGNCPSWLLLYIQDDANFREPRACEGAV